MSIIFKIAKNELRNLFYSPVAWFLLVIFILQCGYFFTSVIYPFAHSQEIQIANSPYFRNWEISLTNVVFLGQNGIFLQILGNLFLFIPLLTMGLFSREFNNGTYKLLYSCPLKLRQVVLGKYLGILLFNLLFVFIIFIFVVTAFFSIRDVEYGVLFSAMLGFFLIICSYSAIGMFMSTLTTYQIASAIGTFAVLFILGRIGSLWQQYDFVRDLTWFLSLVGRTAKMLLGLITSKDVIYFLIVIFMFVGFTLVKVGGDTETRPWYIKLSRYLGIVTISLTIGYISSRPSMTGYWDTTFTNANTIHPRTQEVIKSLDPDKPLEVTLYCNLFDGPSMNLGLPQVRNAYLDYFWEPYVRFKPDIKFNYVYYYDYDSIMAPRLELYELYPGKTLKQIAELKAKEAQVDFSLFISPEEIRKRIDLLPEGKQLVMQLEYNGRKEFLRTFGGWPNESNVNAVFKRLTEAKLPRVTFVTDNFERSPFKFGEREYAVSTASKIHGSSLINVGFDIDTVSLDSRDIPDGTSILAVADPKSNLSDLARRKIQSYVQRGGNMIIMGEPGKQGVVNPLLQQLGLGVQFLQGSVVELNPYQTADQVFNYGTDKIFEMAEEPTLLRRKDILELMKANPKLNYFGADSIGIVMVGVAAMSYGDTGRFKIQPLLLPRGEVTWLKAAPLITDSAAPVFNSKEGDRKEVFPTTLLFSRNINSRTQKIIVCGDADFESNLRLSDGAFPRAMYSYLADKQFPIYTPRPAPKDNFLLISDNAAAIQKIVFVWVLPALVLVSGTILLVRRKRK